MISFQHVINIKVTEMLHLFFFHIEKSAVHFDFHKIRSQKIDSHIQIGSNVIS